MRRVITPILLVGIFITLTLLVPVGLVRADALYGDNLYGLCAYGRACPTTPTPTPTPSPSPTTTPTPPSSPSPSVTPSPQGSATPSSEPTSTPTPGGTTSTDRTPPPGQGRDQVTFGSYLENSSLGKFIDQAPWAIPILLFILLLIMALILTIQAGLEHRNIIRLRTTLERLADLQKSVKIFLQLVQHYLRTPLATITLALELMVSRHDAQATVAQELIHTLSDDTDKLVTEAVNGLTQPPEIVARLDKVRSTLPTTLKSRLFWVPVGAVTVLTVLYNILTLSHFRLDFYVQLIILELAVSFAAILVLMSSVGYARRMKERKLIMEQLVREFADLQKSRQTIVHRLMTTLKPDYELIAPVLARLPESHETYIVMSGYQSIGQLLQKLTIVEELQLAQTFDPASLPLFDVSAQLRETVRRVDVAHPGHQINLQLSDLSTHTVRAPLGLVDFVLAATIQNAVLYSAPRSSVAVRATVHHAAIVVEIRNEVSGGLTEGALQKLFEPFSRIDDALQFDTSGAGMSLYVSRIIMRALGGDVTLGLEGKDGSVVVCMVTVPLAVEGSRAAV